MVNFSLHPVLVFLVRSCEVSIHPKVNAVMFGASLNLTCTVSCSNYSELRWEVALPFVLKKGDGWINLYITRVTEWSLPLSCLVNYGDFNQTYTKKVIYVYGKYLHFMFTIYIPKSELEGIIRLGLDLVFWGKNSVEALCLFFPTNYKIVAN